MHDEHYLTVYGRLKPGVDATQVQSQLDAVAMRLRRDFPKDDETISFGTVPFVEQFVGDYRQRLLTLLAAVGARAAHRLRQRRQPAAGARRRRGRARSPSAPRSAPANGASSGNC